MQVRAREDRDYVSSYSCSFSSANLPKDLRTEYLFIDVSIQLKVFFQQIDIKFIADKLISWVRLLGQKNMLPY